VVHWGIIHRIWNAVIVIVSIQIIRNTVTVIVVFAVLVLVV
jgi:hypothetical protein